MMCRILKHLVVTALVACASLLAHADNLVKIKNTALPAFNGAVTTMFAAHGRPVLVDASGRLWELDAAQNSWQALAWTASGTVVGSIANGERPYLLLASGTQGAITSLVQFPDTDTKVASAVALPPLPAPLTQAHGAVLDGTLYLAGLTADTHAQWLALDLKAVQATWTALPAWDAQARNISAVVAQDKALFVTLRQDAGKGDQLWRWNATEGWSAKGELPGTVADGAARAIGQAHILMLVNQAAGAQLVTYHSITRSLALQGAHLDQQAVRGASLGNGLVWQDSSNALSVSMIENSKFLLRPLDWVMLVIYLVGIAGIGVYCYWREEKQSTAEFFVGNRTIPFWAAAVSLYVTSTSSIGYIATTAKAFATNWQYLVNNIVGVLGLIFVAIWIVPMLRRLRLVSVFDYLEQRFHVSVRLVASAMCIVLHLCGRMSVILFLPSLAIATITGFEVTWSILIMGLVTIGYTALGGMRAVIWTDFVQLIVKVGGLVFAFIFILYKLDGGFGQFMDMAQAGDKMHMLDWSFDLTKATVWGFVFLVLMETVLTFPKDQILMQRVFTTKSDKEAGRSVWLFAAIIIPGAGLFYLIGTGLWVFYQAHPERMNPLLSVDATFPLFIAAELPAGITGLIIAGIFAASMATCSSIINSVATMVSVDFYEKLAKNPTQKTSIRLAEWVTAIAGLSGIGLALLLSRYSISSYLDVALELFGLLGGGFGGAYTLGMFTRRANWQGVLIGMFASIVLTFAAWSINLVHPFIYLAIAILFSIVFGYIGSLFFPAPDPASLKGLIIER
jgi:SSS family transporter